MTQTADLATMPLKLDDEKKSPIWPLDLGIAALVVASMGLAYQRLEIGAANLLEDARLYLVLAPVIGLVGSIMSRVVDDSIVRRSVQFAFVGSLLTHLMLIVLAINYDVFAPYFATAKTGVKPDRAPIKRTVPDYLFENRPQPNAAVDWSQPAPTQTASPVKPNENRKLPPVDQTAMTLQLPSLSRSEESSDAAHLRRIELESLSKPQAADSPSKLARQLTKPDRSTESPPTSNESIKTPDIAPPIQTAAATSPAASSPAASSPSSSVTMPTPPGPPARRRKPTTSMSPPTPLQSPITATAPRLFDAPVATSSLSIKNLPDVPTLGGSNLPQPHRRRQSDRSTRAAAGSPPSVTSVPIAKLSPATSRRIDDAAPTGSPRRRQSRAGMSVASPEIYLGVMPVNEAPTIATAPDAAMGIGLPQVAASNRGGRDGSIRRDRIPSLYALDPASNPEIDVPVVVSASTIGQNVGESGNEAALMSSLLKPRTDRSRQPLANLSPSEMSESAAVDITAPEGRFGLGILPADRAGLVPDPETNSISAAIDLSPVRRERRKIGGPVIPAGRKVAAVETFARRIERTKGGAAPSPAGEVGPDTEEAIERGLAYLSSSQNDDGSWSLQGHGDRVVLQSDTAATGLALLSFQGAGYTHRKHQYAETVAKGIEWLRRNQRSNGNLYRAENDLSDRNVALYSHGIAALAMSEAFGMTQDESIRNVAQGALDYIVSTQHRELGGWRYTPQKTSDTSVSGWMMMALKSGELGGLEVPEQTYDGINHWLDLAQVDVDRADRYRYNPFAPDTETQRHGRLPTPTMTAVGMLMRMYSGWRRDNPAMQSAAKYLLKYPPTMGTTQRSQRDAYYWYYATQVMFHMGGETWQQWNRYLNPVLLESQLIDGPYSGSWDPNIPVKDRWSIHGGRMYVTTMNLLNLEVYYRHLPIYEETAK